jgi:hypothetical protein
MAVGYSPFGFAWHGALISASQSSGSFQQALASELDTAFF